MKGPGSCKLFLETVSAKAGFQTNHYIEILRTASATGPTFFNILFHLTIRGNHLGVTLRLNLRCSQTFSFSSRILSDLVCELNRTSMFLWEVEGPSDLAAANLRVPVNNGDFCVLCGLASSIWRTKPIVVRPAGWHWMIGFAREYPATNHCLLKSSITTSMVRGCYTAVHFLCQNHHSPRTRKELRDALVH